MFAFKKLKLIPALALCASLFALPALADDDYPLSLYEQFQEYRDLAVQNDPEAQYQLGLMYLKGQGVELDRVTGRNWLLKAAEADHVEAINTLGLLSFPEGYDYYGDPYRLAGVFPQYQRGQDPTNYVESFTLIPAFIFNTEYSLKMFQRAAGLGSAKAQNNIGIYYSSYEDDEKTADEWFEKAYQNGSLARIIHERPVT